MLLKADGESVDTIADKLDLNRNSILLYLRKHKEGGVENALTDAPGRGRNSEISDDEKAWVIDAACRKPTDFGCAAEIWTHAKLISLLNRHQGAFEQVRRCPDALFLIIASLLNPYQSAFEQVRQCPVALFSIIASLLNPYLRALEQVRQPPKARFLSLTSLLNRHQSAFEQVRQPTDAGFLSLIYLLNPLLRAFEQVECLFLDEWS